MPHKAHDLSDILKGHYVKCGKALMAKVDCPCCGALHFKDSINCNVRHLEYCEYPGDAHKDFVADTTCENCGYYVEDCPLYENGDVARMYSDYKFEEE